jgi:hypothetical protein
MSPSAVGAALALALLIVVVFAARGACRARFEEKEDPCPPRK